ncbi:MAG: glycosyltransferase family 4 protein [Acidimicrobiales bacterium]
MRIAQVCPYSLTIPGGVQGQVLGLARAFRELGHDARVLGPCDGPPPEPGVEPLGQSIPLATNGSVAPIAPDMYAALRTVRALRAEAFDVVHVHEPLVPGPSMTALLFSDAALVGTFHRSGPSQAYRWFGPMVRMMARRLGRRCAVSVDARSTAQSALGGHYDLVFNGIDVDRFAKATPAPTTAPTVFFIGRHEVRKGLDVLIEAFDGLDGAILWVAGDGPQTQELKSRSRDNQRIEWLGRITDAEAARRMAGADVVCAPSLRGESFGVILLEAMAARTALVATDLPAYRRVARPGIDALLVPPGDAGQLAAALSRALFEPGLAARLVESAQSRANEYSMDRLAQRYLDIFDQTAPARAR